MMNYKRWSLFLGLVMVGGLTGTGQVWGQSLRYNGSMQMATGSYFFEENTRSFYLTNGLGIRNGRYGMSVDVPFVVQSSPWISYSRYGGIPTGGPQHESVGQHYGRRTGQGMGGRRKPVDLADTASYTQSGFSDPSLSLQYQVLGSESGATALYFTTSIKFPLADPANGFGTGAWDASIGSSVSRRFDTWFTTANFMYWHFGDMPDLELKSSLTYGAGIGKSFSGGHWLVLGSFNGMTEIIDGVTPPMSATLGIGYQVGARTSLNISTSFGLSESSADVAFGGGWQVKLY
ncbi:hypothetical protein [Fodinibius sp.]|uniref:hypothetical protein n=1 Tax=Fodinibius sp. TaxID=1872440 RepID=UPI003567F80F